MTECARVILCDPESPGSLTAPGASAGRPRDGARSASALDTDGDESDGRIPGVQDGPTVGQTVGHGDVPGRTTHFGLERRTRAAGPSRVAIGGGTAHADRAVRVSRASGANRARAVRPPAGPCLGRGAQTSEEQRRRSASDLRKASYRNEPALRNERAPRSRGELVLQNENEPALRNEPAFRSRNELGSRNSPEARVVRSRAAGVGSVRQVAA